MKEFLKENPSLIMMIKLWIVSIGSQNIWTKLIEKSQNYYYTSFKPDCKEIILSMWDNLKNKLKISLIKSLIFLQNRLIL